jgi:hypothetical protein
MQTGCADAGISAMVTLPGNTSALKAGNCSAAAAASRLEESLVPSKIVSQTPGPEHSGKAT